jgi:acetoin utilization deacetylase AcuC-like enzyme
MGYDDECGEGVGAGWNLNVPLDAGVEENEYLRHLDSTLEVARSREIVGTVVLLGVDTYIGDPISDLRLTTDSYHRMGSLLRSLNVPMVVVQEGGYNQIELGLNVHQFLRGIAGLDKK